MSLDILLAEKASLAASRIFQSPLDPALIQVQPTRKEFRGDYTLVVFPLLKYSRKNPVLTGQELGQALMGELPELEGFEVHAGFLNCWFRPHAWLNRLNDWAGQANFGFKPASEGQPVMIEYSSPNTNKPLHLGHIRNNLLGFSIARIFEANGHRVLRVNLVNDRGIHICKSMLAWKRWGKLTEPADTGQKGDHLVGDWYVRFDKEYRQEIKHLVDLGMKQEEAEKKAPILLEAQEMLRKWEAGDPETIHLWKKMNGWVYEGFEETYRRLGISFDRVYHESETYHLGKQIVLQSLAQGKLIQREDGAILADLSQEGLDQKVLLRPDGTSVYMTQDIGTAHQRFTEYQPSKLIYVVGNEQNYHFEALKKILVKLGYEWASQMLHLSYGMVELPTGKMKSREGTVVDADQLLDEMEKNAWTISEELGKLDEMEKEEAEKTVSSIALAALKYFILKVDPKKNMLFIPEESIDFNGNTGPFIQYAFARICSIQRKALAEGFSPNLQMESNLTLNEKERNLLRALGQFPSLVAQAKEELSPALVANYAFELAREFNQFYHDYPILKEANSGLKDFRFRLSLQVGRILKSSLWLLGIEAPEKM